MLGTQPKGRLGCRPLKVGGGIQPRLVTVLTPVTTFTVEKDSIQKVPAVNKKTCCVSCSETEESGGVEVS